MNTTGVVDHGNELNIPRASNIEVVDYSDLIFLVGSNLLYLAVRFSEGTEREKGRSAFL